jgi:hypothetical protein
MSHPKVVKLIVSQSKCKERLDLFKRIEMTGPPPTLHSLTSPRKRFEKFLEGGMRWDGSDIITIIQLHFPDKTMRQLRKPLMDHPYWRITPLANSTKVLNYILDMTVGESLFKLLPIILYPFDQVVESFQVTLESGEAKLKDPYFLQMALYFIEKLNKQKKESTTDYDIKDFL